MQRSYPRSLRIEAVLQQAIAQVLQREYQDNFKQIVLSVSAVQVSRDLKLCESLRERTA